jgi:hypothetical protein
VTASEPAIALRVLDPGRPGLEVRVNFGVFAGRDVTPAEIEELALLVRELVPEFSIVAEERHEFGEAAEVAVHQVVVEVRRELCGTDPDVLAERIVLAANGWARDCIASREGGGDL